MPLNSIRMNISETVEIYSIYGTYFSLALINAECRYLHTQRDVNEHNSFQKWKYVNISVKTGLISFHW